MRTLNFFCCLLLLILAFQNSLFSQLKINMERNLISEREIYINEKSGVRYSDLITLKFRTNIVDVEKGLSKIDLSDILEIKVKNHFVKIREQYGEYEILKLISSATWGDTLVINKRSKKVMTIPDWSQVFQLKFDNLVPLDSIITGLNTLSLIEYAEGPFQAYLAIEPNDAKYINGNNWAFRKIKAPEAWSLTKGSSSITIAIHDCFEDSANFELHEDLIGKVDNYFHIYGNNSNNHGICVAGVAGANTNNGIGIASLGWNLRLQLYDNTLGIPAILEAIKKGVDVINFSWFRRVDLQSLNDAIKTALANGIVCVAATGNDYYAPPETVYPAAYNFGELGQVIAVSATELVGNDERFIDGWNYSPGNDPLFDPKNSFIDVAAPGRDIEILSENECTAYSRACGTSLSTPFVSALAGLILSIDSTLTHSEVYTIITSTADKIGQYPYDENGWNQYLGYGRINAFRALEKVKLFTNNHLEGNKVSSSFLLHQNHPNPFNPSTTIKYSISKQSKVILKVFDLVGSEVVTLINKEQSQGNYQIEFEASDLTSGIYFYRLQVYTPGRAGDFGETKKMILLK
jgi:Subtilase family/Secretion system C-terminal sorting domain